MSIITGSVVAILFGRHLAKLSLETRVRWSEPHGYGAGLAPKRGWVVPLLDSKILALAAFARKSLVETLIDSLSPMTTKLRSIERKSTKHFSEFCFEDMSPTEIRDIFVKIYLKDIEKKDALAQGIIIVAWKTVIESLRFLDSAYRLNLGGDYDQAAFKDEITRLGPKANKTLWAAGLIAASNYIRHNHDWEEQANQRLIIILGGEPDYEKAIKGLSKKAKRNVSVLKQLGFRSQQLLSHSGSLSYLMVKALQLDNPKNASRNSTNGTQRR